MECGSLARCALDGDRASMGEDDVFDDGEPKSSSAAVARAVFVNAIKAVEDKRLRAKRDAWSVVSDGDGEVGVISFCGDGKNEFSRVAVAEGIGEEIQVNLFHATAVCLDDAGILWPLDLDACLCFRNGGIQIFQYAQQEVVEVHGIQFQKAGPAFHLGDAEKIFDEEIEALDIALDGFQRTFGHFGFLHGAVEKGFHVALDNGERGAEFMGDIGNEFPACGLKVADVGDILENEKHGLREGAGVGGERGNVNVEMLLSRGSFRCDRLEDDLDLLGFPTCERSLAGMLEFMPSKILQQSSSNRGPPRRKEIQESLIDQRYPLGAVDDEDALDHAGENTPQAEIFVRNLAVELQE